MTGAARPTEVIVIGSGAGGATTALTLAQAGLAVTVLEEGARVAAADYGADSATAMQRLYRRRGMTPIVGKVPLGFVEGRCVGGSTEINSGFWHRTPPEVLLRWKVQYGVDGISPAELEPHFAWAEAETQVSAWAGEWPRSTRVFARGIEAMGWSGQEVPRTAHRCAGTNACARGCPTGAKQGMSRSLLPRAEAAGARVIPRCRVRMILTRRSRAVGVLAELEHEDGVRELVRLDADHVFVCGGPTETPALLRRSGLKRHVGDQFRIHPMLKVAAAYDELIDAHRAVLPLLQVKEFWPEISLGGAFFSPGHLALVLGDSWPAARVHLGDYRRMATFYVAVKGTGRGWVRPSAMGSGESVLHYDLSGEDLRHLSRGLARLSTLLLAGGARVVIPGGAGLPAIRTPEEAIRWLDELLPARGLGLTTVHAFSSCPMGERADRCAVDSYGRVHGFENLHVNDASLLPDSPGVNPQGSVMAVAHRNAQHFLAGRV
jgi:choline dehydrogenase-like flavoprotein